jgi:hypothetical protein
MPGRKVRHDLRQVRKHSAAYGLQEFRWEWYWRAMNLVMAVGTWGMYPNRRAGFAKPIQGAQAVGWRRSLWKRVGAHVMTLMEASHLTNARYLRAVLLEDRKTKMRCWHGSTHFLVGGDNAPAKSEKRRILATNIVKLHNFLTILMRTGDPIVFELDANIHKDTEAYQALRQVVHELGGTFHGVLGVEYMFTMPGKDTKVICEEEWVIPTKILFTDHEGRGMTYYLARH